MGFREIDQISPLTGIDRYNADVTVNGDDMAIHSASFSPVEVKSSSGLAVAIYLDLQFGADIGCTEFLLEGDSKEIIRKLQSTSEDLSTVRLIVSDIKEAVRILTLNPTF
ncbi:hypothetical protein GQ457_07G011130 [Hibiscus cannabinus]